MSTITDDIAVNIEQIRINDINITSMRSGCGTQTRSTGESIRDDTAESISRLMKCNADLRGANAILAAAL
jgi:hypothetical protein